MYCKYVAGIPKLLVYKWFAMKMMTRCCVVQGLDQFCAAEIRGLTMKAQTHLLEDAQPDSPTASAHDKQTGSTAGGADPAGVSPRSQQTASSILEPCDITASYKLTSALQDVSMDVTDLRLRVSPDVMQLVLHLQQVGSREACSAFYLLPFLLAASQLFRNSST